MENQRTALEIQNSVLQKLLLGLEKQAERYLDLIADEETPHKDRQDYDKELSDINKVLTELAGKTVTYTVGELEALKVAFNQRLEDLNGVISNLEINTLKIEFEALTSEQKESLKVKGDKGNQGDSNYTLALRYGFVGTEQEYLASLRGKDGKDGKFEDLTQSQKDSLKGKDGKDGLSAYELALKNGFDGTEQEYLTSLKGKDGNDGKDGLSSYELALKNGFDGTEQEYLESLKGSSNQTPTPIYSVPDLFLQLRPYFKQFEGQDDINEYDFNEYLEYQTLLKKEDLLDKISSFYFIDSFDYEDLENIRNPDFYSVIGKYEKSFILDYKLATPGHIFTALQMNSNGNTYPLKTNIFGTGGTYEPNPNYVPFIVADLLKENDVNDYFSSLKKQFSTLENVNLDELRKAIYPLSSWSLTEEQKEKVTEIEVFTVAYMLEKGYDLIKQMPHFQFLFTEVLNQRTHYNNETQTNHYDEPELPARFAFYVIFKAYLKQNPIFNDILNHIKG